MKATRALVVIAVGTMVAASAAAMPPITVAPAKTLAPVVHVTGFQLGTSSDPSALAYSVTVHNAGAVQAMVDLHFVRFGNAESLTPHTVTIAAKSDATVTLTDKTAGMNCGLSYELWLVGNGADPTKRDASLDSNCTFATQVTDSLASIPSPDIRKQQETGKAFFASASAPAFQGCTKMKVDIDLFNRTSVTGKNLEVALRDPRGVAAWQGNVGDVGAGTSKHVAMSAFLVSGAADKMTVDLIDPVQSLGGKVASQSVRIQITPTCTAKAVLKP